MMKGNKRMKTTANVFYPAIAAIRFAWLALSSVAQALNPSPDGGNPVNRRYLEPGQSLGTIFADNAIKGLQRSKPIC
jgi:hypothetical protein